MHVCLASYDHHIRVNLAILTRRSVYSLDIIGRVAFGHDFGSGESVEAKAIAAAWNKDVQFGLTTTGALAPIIIQSFPWITSLPIPDLLKEGVTKSIAKDLASKILAKGQINEKDKDILSLLVRGTGEQMADEQLLENISTFMFVFGRFDVASDDGIDAFALQNGRPRDHCKSMSHVSHSNAIFSNSRRIPWIIFYRLVPSTLL